MTLKQLKTIEALPKNNYNIAKCLREAGFTKGSARAGTTYRALRRITQKLDFFDPERIKRDIDMTFKLAKQKEDITNLSRINEHRSKIAGMITDKSENKTAITIDEQRKLVRDGLQELFNTS
jgi:hypothetical protein